MARSPIFPRLSRMSLSIVLLFTILTMAVGMFMSMLFEQENLRRIGRGFYSDDAVFFHFSVNSERLGQRFPELADVEGQTDYLIVNAIRDIRGVYLAGEPETPPMIEGRFMTPEESARSQPVAVVGDNRWDEVIKRGTSHTIDLLGQRYEVIGRMGTSYPSSINRLIMVNMASVSADQVAAGRIYVDGKDPESVFTGMQQRSRDLEMSAPVRVDSPMEAIDVLSIQNNWGLGYLVTIIAVMLLSSAILMVEWIRRKIHMIAVFRLVGYDSRRICFGILRDHLFLALIGIGLALGIMGILIQFQLFDIKTAFIRQALYVAGFTLLTGLCITIPALLRAVRIDVVKILR